MQRKIASVMLWAIKGFFILVAVTIVLYFSTVYVFHLRVSSIAEQYYSGLKARDWGKVADTLPPKSKQRFLKQFVPKAEEVGWRLVDYEATLDPWPSFRRPAVAEYGVSIIVNGDRVHRSETWTWYIWSPSQLPRYVPDTLRASDSKDPLFRLRRPGAE